MQEKIQNSSSRTTKTSTKELNALRFHTIELHTAQQWHLSTAAMLFLRFYPESRLLCAVASPEHTFVFTCTQSLNNPRSFWCPNPNSNLSHFYWLHIPFWQLMRNYKAKSRRLRCFWLSVKFSSFADSQVSLSLKLVGWVYLFHQLKRRNSDKTVNNISLSDTFSEIRLVCIMIGIKLWHWPCRQLWLDSETEGSR